MLKSVLSFVKGEDGGVVRESLSKNGKSFLEKLLGIRKLREPIIKHLDFLSILEGLSN